MYLDFIVNQKYTCQEFIYVLLFHIVAPHCTKMYLNICIANIIKDENNMTKNSTTFPNYITNVPIKDDEIMVSFEVTSLYTKIPIIDTLNIIKIYVNNDYQFTRKMTIPQEKFFDLVDLVLTATWCTFNSQFYQQTDDIAMGSEVSSSTAEFYMQAHECNTYGITPSKSLGTVC